MSILSSLPDLPDLGNDFARPAGEAPDLGKIAIPALGALTIGGAGGGGLLRGFIQGMQMKLARHERTTEREERLRQMRANYIADIAAKAGQFEDPVEFEQFVGLAERTGAETFGLKPGELREVITFPAGRRQKRQQQLARERVAELQRLYENFWSPEIQRASVPFEGRNITVGELVNIADILASRETTKPVTERVPVPRREEGGLSRFLAPRTEERVVGTERVVEPVLPQKAQPLTFDMLWPKAQGTAWEGRAVPIKDGVPDLRTATAIAKDNGWIVTTSDQLRMQDRYQQFLRDKLVAGLRNPGSVNLGMLRRQVDQAGMNWAVEKDRAQQQIARDAKSLKGTDVLGAPVLATGTTGGFDVRPVRNPQGLVTHYAINGQQFTVQQTRAEAYKLVADGDPSGVELALKVGVSQDQVQRWVHDAIRQARAAVNRAAISGAADPAAEARLDALTRLLSPTPMTPAERQRHEAARGQPAPSQPTGAQAPPTPRARDAERAYREARFIPQAIWDSLSASEQQYLTDTFGTVNVK